MKQRLHKIAFFIVALVCGAVAVEADIITGRAVGHAYIRRLAGADQEQEEKHYAENQAA